MDQLKLAQLATLIGMMGQGAAQSNPGQAKTMDSLVGSGQSAIQAEAQKKAQKDAEKKKDKGIGKMLGTAGAVAAAPFTGGASLAYLPMATAAGGAVDSAIQGDMQGVASNAAQAGMGYMGGKSFNANQNTPAPTPTAPGAPSTAPPTPTTPPPLVPSSMNTKATAPPASPPPLAPSTGGSAGTAGGAGTTGTTPAAGSGGGDGGFNLGAGILSGLAGYGVTRGAENMAMRRRGEATPGQLRSMDDKEMLARQPSADGKWGGNISAPGKTDMAAQRTGQNQPQKMTERQARAMGLPPERIAQMKQQGLITEDNNNALRNGILAGMAGGMLG